MDRQSTIVAMNDLGKRKKPFFFIIDYEMENCHVYQDGLPDDVSFCINAPNEAIGPLIFPTEKHFECFPVAYTDYEKAYLQVMSEIHFGNSYLVNLTFQTPIQTNYTLSEIFQVSQAPYKLLFKDQFVVFSPETFVRIKDGRISSHPMKGTIDAALPNAAQLILSDIKETAEHATITDLIRNDLAMVSRKVEVRKYRYLDLIRTNGKDLLQVSSEISGLLPKDFHQHLGDILFALLPAGSICGAPKTKTLEIIAEAENYKRGYYTGIFGCFDGENLESAVSIRFIEKQNGQLFYKSGGGITSMSVCEDEYQELIDKIYVPIC